MKLTFFKDIQRICVKDFPSLSNYFLAYSHIHTFVAIVHTKFCCNCTHTHTKISSASERYNRQNIFWIIPKHFHQASTISKLTADQQAKKIDLVYLGKR